MYPRKCAIIKYQSRSGGQCPSRGKEDEVNANILSHDIASGERMHRQQGFTYSESSFV